MRKCKIPDPRAPKYRAKSLHILTPTFYNKFYKQYPQYKDTFGTSVFLDVLTAYGKATIQAVVDNREGADLPQRLGVLFLGTCPTPKVRFPQDYSRQAEGIATRYHNWDTDNKLLKIFYLNFQKRYNFTHKSLWGFMGSTDFRKKASKAYLLNWKKYIEVENHLKIYRTVQQYQKEVFAKKREVELLKTYNEFEID